MLLTATIKPAYTLTMPARVFLKGSSYEKFTSRNAAIPVACYHNKADDALHRPRVCLHTGRANRHYETVSRHGLGSTVRVERGRQMKYAAALLTVALVGCASTTTTSGKQDLVMDKEIQPMSRAEVVSAIGDCQSVGLRAVLMYGKRKVNGSTADVVIDVTCAPKW